MSANNIPFDIQVEIIKKVLPVKSLIRFRSVSKQWKSLIDSSQFIMDHCVNQAQPHHLLVSYKVDNEDKYVSIADDDSFPHHKFSPPVPPTVKLLRGVILVGCSHGLVCLSGYTPGRRNRKEVIVVWNPAIRKSIDIPLPYGLFVFGFGVCPKTNDIKIVKITLSRQETDPRSSVCQKAEVFTLGSGAWRTIYMNLSCKLVNILLNPVVIDGVIHWVTSEQVPKNDLSHHLILKFDLTSEEFELVDLPFSTDGCGNHLSKLNESLVVFHNLFIFFPVLFLLILERFCY